MMTLRLWIVAFLLLASWNAYSYDYYCHITRTESNALTNECTDEDKEEQDDVICAFYSVNTDGEGSGGLGDGNDSEEDQEVLKGMEGCFKGLNDYLFSGQAGKDLANGYNDSVKGLHKARSWANDKLWKPIEKGWKSLFGGSSSDTYDQQKQQYSLFINSRKGEINTIVDTVSQYEKNWKPTSNLIGDRESEINQSQGLIDLDIDRLEDEFADFGGSLPGVSGYPYGTPFNTPQGFNLFQAKIYHTNVSLDLELYNGPDKPKKIEMMNTADVFLSAGDQYYQGGDIGEGDNMVGLARELIDTVAGFTPGVSLGLDLFQLSYGYNPITGATVSDVDKGLIVGSLAMPSVLSGSAKAVVKLGRVLKGMSGNPVAKRMVGWLKKSDTAVEPLVRRNPCGGVASNRSLPQRIINFIFPVAYAGPCDGLGGNTGKAIQNFGKAKASALANSKPGEATAEMIKEFRPSAYRANMTRLQLGKNGGKFPSNYEAHHLLPKELVDDFLDAGVWVHDPRLLLPVEKTIHTKVHNFPGGNLERWNDEWTDFLDGSPTREMILEKARVMTKEYGLQDGYPEGFEPNIFF